MNLGEFRDWFKNPLPAARRTDPETSHQAAADATPNAAALRDIVLAADRANPDGLTDFELVDIVGYPASAPQRRGDQVKLGLIEATEMKRPSPSGSKAIVWRAVTP